MTAVDRDDPLPRREGGPELADAPPPAPPADERRWAAAVAPLLTRLEVLVNTEERRSLEETLTALRGQPAAPAELGHSGLLLRLRLDEIVARAGEKLAELRAAEDRRRLANLPRLASILARVEALAAAVDAELRAALAEAKILQAEWRALGGVPREQGNELWDRFTAAWNQLQDRAHAEFARNDEERLANLAKKSQLCEQAEALADWPAWQEAVQTLKVLQEEWRSIGAVPRQQSEAVWQRFRRAADQLFARREVDPTASAAGQGATLALLSGLCERAEALQDSNEWKATADVLKALQNEWRQVRSPGSTVVAADALWQRFRAACDHFFDRRQAALLVQDEQRRANLAAKQALLERARSLAEAPDLADPEAAIRLLMNEWKAIGSVPRDQSEDLWARFCAACEALRQINRW